MALIAERVTRELRASAPQYFESTDRVEGDTRILTALRPQITKVIGDGVSASIVFTLIDLIAHKLDLTKLAQLILLLNPRAMLSMMINFAHAYALFSYLALNGLLNAFGTEGYSPVILADLRDRKGRTPNRDSLHSDFKYLVNRGFFVFEGDDHIRATALGAAIIRSMSGFGVPKTYSDIYTPSGIEHRYYDPGRRPLKIDRAVNSESSGRTHQPWFELGLDLIGNISRKNFLDVGCGSGHWLKAIADTAANATVFGIDLNVESLEVTYQTLAGLRNRLGGLDQGNILDPHGAAQFLQRFGCLPEDTVVTSWNIFHEIFGVNGMRYTGRSEPVDFAGLLTDYYRAGFREIIFCEILDPEDPELLARSFADHTIASYIHFHEESGQRVKPRREIEAAIAASPFRVVREIVADHIEGKPVAMIWHIVAGSEIPA